jgi:hypothetical protein
VKTQRTATLLLLTLLLGCSSAETTTTDSSPELTKPGRARLVIETVWTSGKTVHHVGGVKCSVRRLDADPTWGEQISTEGKPIVVETLKPGRYVLTVSARKRSYTTDEFVTVVGKTTTVRVDLLIAKDLADENETLKDVGNGLFRVITAPVRLTLKVFGASETPKEGKAPFEIEEKPTSR